MAPGEVTLPGGITGDFALWAGGVRAELVNTVFIRDLRRHITSVLAVARPGWRTDWVKAAGDWAVYMEASEVAEGEADWPDWRMLVVNLPSGKTHEIARSDKPSGPPPSPTIAGDRVLWAAGPAGKSNLLLHDLGTRRTITLLRGRHILDTGISGTTAAFVLQTAGRRDIYTLSVIQPRAMRRLTTSGQILRANISDGFAAYEVGPEGADPRGQLLSSLVGGSETRITVSQPGQVAPSNATPGQGLVAWFDGHGLRAARTAAPQRAEVLTQMPDVQLRLEWDGTRLLWGETQAGMTGIQNTLHVTAWTAAR